MSATERWDEQDALRQHAARISTIGAALIEAEDPGELERIADGDIELARVVLARSGGPALAGLLAEVEAVIRRFVAFQNTHQSAACALWVAHCHAIDAAPMAAYLRITSAVEESGKTTLVELLDALLGPQAVNAVSATPASIFRYRDKEGAVALLLDEIDNTIRDRKDDAARDLLALINAGYRRSATVLRVIGRDHAPKRFKAFGPVAIAGLGTLHPTTESRCIPIILERKAQASLEPWISFRHEDEIGALQAELAAWATSAVEALRDTEPQRPDGLRDRHYEAWWGMFAIADAAGGDWGERARTAAVALHTGRDEEAVSLGVLMLRHVRQAFDEAKADRLPTADLLDRLVANEEGPWGRWWGTELRKEGAPVAAAADLATKLRPFGVKPRVVRVGDGTARGYLLDDFAKPFGLYLPPVTPVTPVTGGQSRNQGPVTPVTPVTGGKPNAEGVETTFSETAHRLQAALGRPPLDTVFSGTSWCHDYSAHQSSHRQIASGVWWCDACQVPTTQPVAGGNP